MNYEELVKAHQLIDEYESTRHTSTWEPRLYYDSNGEITAYYEVDHPTEGNYIVLDHPDVFFKNNTILMRVINGQLHIIKNQPARATGIVKSTQGQPVVSGMAALALAPDEKYQTVEYYGPRTNS